MKSPAKEAAQPEKDSPRDFVCVKSSSGTRFLIVADESGQFDKALIQSLTKSVPSKRKK
jgi:hypothetical protein